jgi:hypothetical protein
MVVTRALDYFDHKTLCVGFVVIVALDVYISLKIYIFAQGFDSN